MNYKDTSDEPKEDPAFGPYRSIVNFFAQGKRVEVNDLAPDAKTLTALREVVGLEELAKKHVPLAKPELELAAAMEFVLEGLHQSRLLAKDDLDGGVGYRDMLGSMFEGLDQGDGPPNPPRERGRRK
jgi:hypothetical protein